MDEEIRKKLNKYTVKDLSNPKKREEIEKIRPGFFKDMNSKLKNIMKHDAKKQAQPFITNDLLNSILSSQTPKWVNYLILIITTLTLIASIVVIIRG